MIINHIYHELATFQEDFITFILLYVLRATILNLFSSTSSGGYDTFFRAIKVTVKRDQLQSGHALAIETHRRPRLRKIETNSRAALSMRFSLKNIITINK